MSDVSREVLLDAGRRARIGLDEAILCETKTPAQLSHILDEATAANHSMFLTRLSERQVQTLREEHAAALDYHALSQTGIVGDVPPPEGPARIAIVAAGSSDAAVAHEAARTLAYAGVPSELVCDVGVAGLWRLLDQVDRLAEMDVIIAVAGMDAAMVSVIGGLVPGLVIAVPVSTGYGAARNGETALYSSLTSCSPGVAVVNIDNGFGAACAALRAIGHARANRADPVGVDHAR
ncbi:MAG: nickel pincer cofactor biosynthesis protein LarB [Rhodospirillales bacterium]|nr:nickel pincer cofactor biosynthesis protein LarB [Rhodospirillales bacterium]